MSFAAWNGYISKVGSSVQFDLTPGEGWVNQGTEELVSACLMGLGIERAFHRWSVLPFCSPYYGILPTAEDYRDYCLAAWRFSVELEPGPPMPRFLPIRSVVIDTLDSSWVYERRYSEWVERACVVIANFPFRDVAFVRSRIEATSLGTRSLPIDVFDLGGSLTQVRVDLGVRKFPEARTAVAEIVMELEDMGGATHWGRLT